MGDTLKWAFVGDLQIPYHDKRALDLFMRVMKSWRPQAIDVVGDIDDQLEYSSFSDGTTDEFFNQLKKEEDNNPLPFIKKNADGAKEFYAALRAQHKRADIHASLGNHDIRIFKYIDKKAPDFKSDITPDFLWGLDNVGISYRMYSEPPLQRFAGIHVHHGATTTATGLAVRSDIETYNISLVRGHDHRGGVVYKSYPMTQQVLKGMGTGHMCDPKQYGLQYTINPSWELGFGIAHVENDTAHLQFIPITPEYTCIVDGKLFAG
jgi:hypothetical protein